MYLLYPKNLDATACVFEHEVFSPSHLVQGILDLSPLGILPKDKTK